jgi:hypothetical protein
MPIEPEAGGVLGKPFRYDWSLGEVGAAELPPVDFAAGPPQAGELDVLGGVLPQEGSLPGAGSWPPEGGTSPELGWVWRADGSGAVPPVCEMSEGGIAGGWPRPDVLPPDAPEVPGPPKREPGNEPVRSPGVGLAVGSLPGPRFAAPPTD